MDGAGLTHTLNIGNTTSTPILQWIVLTMILMVVLVVLVWTLVDAIKHALEWCEEQFLRVERWWTRFLDERTGPSVGDGESRHQPVTAGRSETATTSPTTATAANPFWFQPVRRSPTPRPDWFVPKTTAPAGASPDATRRGRRQRYRAPAAALFSAQETMPLIGAVCYVTGEAVATCTCPACTQRSS